MASNKAIHHKISEDLVFVCSQERMSGSGHYERTKVPTKKFAYKVKTRDGRVVRRVTVFRYDEGEQQWVS